MTVQLNFRYPDAWVPLPFDDAPAGAVMAAQTVLGRFNTPVPREAAIDLEGRFTELTELMVEAQANAGFALVPDAPAVGLLGWLIVRWTEAAGDDPVAVAIDEGLGDQSLLLDAPDITSVETPLGTATRCVFRYATDPVVLGRFTRKASSPVVEKILWCWAIEDMGGPDLLVTVSSTTQDLTLSPFLRNLVDEFAVGISAGE